MPDTETTILNILVFGPTGAGKSTVINLLTNDNQNLPVGDDLESCTKDIKTASVIYKGRKINFFDTPGFDDSIVKPAEHLSLIAGRLAELYKKTEEKPHIHGVIYLHRITDNRMSGSGLTNLHIFENLIGDHVFNNLVFVTNLWSDPPNPIQEKREALLLTSELYFGKAVKKGAKGGAAFRVRENASHAEVQNTLLDVFLNYEPKVTKIQTEVVVDKMSVAETAAGQVVNQELEEYKKKTGKEMEELNKQITDLAQSNKEAAKDLESLKQDLETQAQNAEAQLKLLKESNDSMMAAMRNRGFDWLGPVLGGVVSGLMRRG